MPFTRGAAQCLCSRSLESSNASRMLVFGRVRRASAWALAVLVALSFAVAGSLSHTRVFDILNPFGNADILTAPAVTTGLFFRSNSRCTAA